MARPGKILNIRNFGEEKRLSSNSKAELDDQISEKDVERIPMTECRGSQAGNGRYLFVNDEDLLSNNDSGENDEKLGDEDYDDGSKGTRLEKILFGISVFLFFLCLLFGALYIQRINRSDDDDGPSKVCSERTCLKVAVDLLQSMNTSVDPCDDFYSFACGGWNKDALFPLNKQIVTRTILLQEELMQALRVALTSPPQNSVTRKGVAFYKSCMDEKRKTALAETPLVELIKSVGSCELFDEKWSGTSWDFVDIFIQLQHMMKKDLPWFNVQVEQQMDQPVITLNEDGLGLKNPSLYINSKETVDEYKEHLVDLIKSLNSKAKLNSLQNSIDDVIRLETRLAENQGNYSSEIITIKELDTWTESKGFTFLDLLQRLFGNNDSSESSFNITEETPVNVRSLHYFISFANRFSQTSQRNQANYMIIHLIRSLVPYLSSEYRKAPDGVYILPSWRTCVNEVAEAMPLLPDRLTMKNLGFSFADDDQIARSIKSAFIKDIDNIHWLTNGPDYLLNKIKPLKISQGFVPEVMNVTTLNNIYKNLDFISSEYFNNVIKSRKFTSSQTFHHYQRSQKYKRWHKSSQEIQLMYNEHNNHLYIPATVVKSSLYHPLRPRALNYGGLGFTIASRLAREFLIEEPESLDKNENCLSLQLRHDPIFEELNNNSEIMKDLATDIAALTTSFKAYQDSSRKDIYLYGLSLNAEQLFFVSYTQLFCQRSKKEKDNLTPWRVSVVLKNSPEFTRVYKCTPNKKLRILKTRDCPIW